MPEIRMLERGEDPLRMHIEPPGPSLAWVFVSGLGLLACGGCFIATMVVYLK